MKKTLIALLMVLLCAMLIISCSNEPKDEGSSTAPNPVSKTINITYDLNGGTLAAGVTNPATATEGETVTPTGPTRNTDTQTAVTNYSINNNLYCDSASGVTTTYTFKGWKVDGADDSTAAETYTAGTEDVKLVAVWNTSSTAASYTGIKLKNTVSKGTTFTLGSYNNSPITWKVLNVDTTNKKALLLATDVIKSSVNKSGGASDNYAWTSSPIYKWFNNTGSDGFLSQCGLTNVSMVGTSGKVFLLLYDELVKYVPDNSDKACSSDWWLRSAGSSASDCQYVTSSGEMINNKNASFDCGVRPAFWINL